MGTGQKRSARSFVVWLSMLASVGLFSGCASHSSMPRAEEPVAVQDYVLGPGDTVTINVWRSPELSQSIPVRPDGKITMPLVEDLQASGKTTTQLARDIERLIGKYVQDPVVTVTVTQFLGTYAEQIRVIGQAAKPQALPYRQGMSLLDVMIAVGGLGEFAAGNRASIVRKVGDNQEQIGVRLADLIKNGDISANMQIRPGDILIIPESFF